MRHTIEDVSDKATYRLPEPPDPCVVLRDGDVWRKLLMYSKYRDVMHNG